MIQEDTFMLQEIQPHIYHSEFKDIPAADDDYMILQDGRNVLLREGPDGLSLPTVSQIRDVCPDAAENAFYLFAIDERSYFSSDFRPGAQGSLAWHNVMKLRELEHDYVSFAGAVGWQLASWYDLHRYCGRCGKKTEHSKTERAIICPECKHVYYPRISPVVIIAIINKDQILLTRYNRNGYRRHALVAGFVEIGETLEDAVRREIMEEVGLRVKNIRYIESQPWPFSSSLIAGFSAEVDGDPTVHLNTDGEEELAEAVWVSRQDITIEDSSVSLTWDMIRQFKAGTLIRPL